MKAAQINEYGDASAVIINEVEQPALQPGQVLVEVYAASLNPFDSMVRSGALKDNIPLQLPITLGGDFAGIVSKVASEVTGLNIDDSVYGQGLTVAGDSGACAEYVAVSAHTTAKAPANISFAEAAALPLVGVSALQAITEHLNLQNGQKLFIHGGAGGIGSIAIQIAKHLGAYVAVTATSNDFEFVKQLGADEVIDYKTQDFSSVLRDYDAVFNTVGSEDITKALKIIKQGGSLVSMSAPADEALASEHGVNTIRQSTQVTTERLDRLRQLVEDDIVLPRVGKIFPLQQAREAFEARDTGTVKGKVILQIISDEVRS